MREVLGIQRTAVDLFASAFALYFIYAIIFSEPFYITTPIYLCCSYILAFCLYPARPGSPRDRITALDFLLSAATVAVTAYFMWQYEYYVQRAGLFRTQDVVAGLVAVVLSIEVCRRVLGWSLPILALVAIAYAMYGNWIPGELGHRGYRLDRVIGQIFSFDGIYGSVTSIYSTYVLLFMIFGAVIQACGMGTFLLELSKSMVGRLRGGIAKTAVVSSGLLGSVVGSGAANIAVTGSFTIPIMKRSGYPAHVAGAIETVASTGGILMPPIMGSTAFILAAFTGVPYQDVALYSFLPAVLFYWGIYAHVHMLSQKLAIPTEPAEESWWSILKRDGYMLLPIALIFVLIFQGTTPYRAALWSIALTFVLHYARPYGGKRMNLLEFIRTFGEGAKLQLSVGVSAGVIGILICMLVLPGLPLKIGSYAVALSQGNLLVLLFLMVVVSYVFGMGIPAVASYIILAVLAVPALVEAGLPVFNAHMIIMWFSLSALWTPPVAVGAFVAAGIAGASPSRIGWYSVKLGIALYIIPFLMAFGTIINGSVTEILFAFVAVAVGLYGFAAATEGYIRRPLASWERMAFLVLAVLAMYPETRVRIAGLALFGAMLIYEHGLTRFARSWRKPAITRTASPGSDLTGS
jgi:TRAP transporter 4TM/12TM fusion protein